MKVVRSSDDLVNDIKNSVADNSHYTASRGEYGAVVGHLTRVCGGRDRRLYLLGWLFGIPGMPMSSKILTGPQIAALTEWIDAQSEDGVWSPSMRFEIEVDGLMRDIEAFLGFELPFDKNKKESGK